MLTVQKRIKSVQSGISKASGAQADVLYAPGDTISFGSQSLQVLSTPGERQTRSNARCTAGNRAKAAGFGFADVGLVSMWGRWGAGAMPQLPCAALQATRMGACATTAAQTAAASSPATPCSFEAAAALTSRCEQLWT